MKEQDVREFPEIEGRLRAYYARQFGASSRNGTLLTRLEPLIAASDVKNQPFPDYDPASEPPDMEPGGLSAGYADKPGSRWSHKARTNRVGALAAVVALALLGVYVFRVLGAGRGGALNPAISATPQALQRHALTWNELLINDDLNDVQMLSATDGWAVGDREPAEGKRQALILHFENGQWKEQHFTIPNTSLSWIDMDSPTDGWAGGVFEPGNAGFLLHYTNGKWTQVATPDGLMVSQIHMLSPDEGWAVEVRLGDGQHMPAFYPLHYSGGKWTRVSSGDNATAAISMLSSSEGWAAGEGGVIEHFQNGAWSRWGQNAPGDVATLQMVSANDGWLAGTAPSWYAPMSEQHPFLMRFNGQRWVEVALPALPTPSQVLGSGQSFEDGNLPSDLVQMSMVSPTDGWVVGSLYGATSLTLHYTDGAWRLDPFTVDMPLESISMLPTGEGWAVGSQNIFSNQDKILTSAVILHYVHGTWSVYTP
jgi:hypothetical protein